MKELTRAEEQVMQILWDLGKGFIKDILAEIPEPKPAYTTISTIVRILEQKGFVTYKAYGKTHEYAPAVTRDAYKRFRTKGLLHDYFSGSMKNLVSFFAEKEKISVKELDEILRIIEEKKKK